MTRRAIAGRQAWCMHSEYLDGLIFRPLMDAGYTAWRDGERVGVVRFVDGRIDVEAGDLRARTALVERLAADLRAAGIMEPCVSSSPERQERSADRWFGSSSRQDTKSAA
jgi:hypothetical protein